MSRTVACSFCPAALYAVLLNVPLTHAADSPPPAPDEVVSAIESVFGATRGERRNHIKGFCATGEFVGTREARALSRSALFSGKSVPVVARFSLAGGNPNAPDTAKSARGMALQFALPHGRVHNITMLNTPMFGAAVPQTFLDLMRAQQPDPATGKPDPEKIKAFKASHPDNRAQAEYLASHNPPASYANSAFWGIHTFKFVDAHKKTSPVRWQFVPLDGEKRLSDDELKTAGAAFLEPVLRERLTQGPVRWEMWVSVGQPGDTETDPTVLWPEDRRRFKAGTLSITAAQAQTAGTCADLNFDPMVMADGILPSDDPVLRFRSPAYAVSFGKRMSEK